MNVKLAMQLLLHIENSTDLEPNLDVLGLLCIRILITKLHLFQRTLLHVHK